MIREAATSQFEESRGNVFADLGLDDPEAEMAAAERRLAQQRETLATTMPPSPPRIIHVSEMARYPDAIYIGRASPRAGLPASPWANPYRIGPDGTREQVIAAYERHIRQSPALLARLPELRGRPLACWCRRSDEPRTPQNACHGDVLVALLAEQGG